MRDDHSGNLVARWRDGDQQAAAELFRRYAERLVGLVRRRLPPSALPPRRTSQVRASRSAAPWSGPWRMTRRPVVFR